MEVGRQFTTIAPEHQEMFARAYERAPEFDRAAVPAYLRMRDETHRQFEHMTAPRSRGGLGIEANVTHEDPYENAGALMHDVTHNHRLNVLSTRSTGGHPLFSDDDNDMFRAVHDYYGHFGTGRGFDRHGEEAAYQAHARMFSPLARQALATETRGQNAMLIRRGAFPQQKIALIGADRAVPQVQRRDLQLQARQFHTSQGLA